MPDVFVVTIAVQTPTVRDMAKLGVCHPGQSYNPTEEDHQDVLASAVAVELRREEALADEKKPISQGMSNETLAVLVGDEVSFGWFCGFTVSCADSIESHGYTCTEAIFMSLFILKLWPTHEGWWARSGAIFVCLFF